MPLVGTLKDAGLAEIFQLIGHQKKTGVLSLRRAESTVQILFEEGKIVYAEAEEKRLEDRLGTILLRRGLITETQLEEALEKQKQTLRRLGHILVNDGYLSKEQMQEALHLQVTQVLYRLFRWQEGEFEFSQEETLEYDREHFVPISPESILMEGMQMIDEWPIIEKKVHSFDMVLAKVPMEEGSVRVKEETEEDPFEESFDWGEGDDEEKEAPEAAEEEEEEGVRLSAQEAAVYELVDGERTVREITYRSSLNEFGTCRILYDLLSRNLITEVRAAPEAAEEEKPASTPRRESHPVLAVGGTLILVLLALAALATLPMSPIGLYRWYMGEGRVARTIGQDISRLRLERIDYALQIYELQNGRLPQELQELADEGYLSEQDLENPWGGPYAYRVQDGEYTLSGTDPDGQVDPNLLIIRTGTRGSGRASSSSSP